jgi:hypothetical protein
MTQLYSNNAKSTLNGAITTGALSITLATGDGAKFPSPTGGDFFLFTMYQVIAGFEANWEIVSCTGRAGDVLTLGARGLEGTTPFAFNNGDFAELRFTAGDAGSLAPKANAVLTTPTLAATPVAGDNSLAVPDTAFVQTAVNGLQSIPVTRTAMVLTAAQAAAQIIVYTGALTGNTTVAVPAAGKTFTVVNNTTGAYTLTQIAVGGTGIAVTQGKSQELICNGTNVALPSTDLAVAGVMPAVAPGTAGNILTSVAGVWASTAPPSSGGNTQVSYANRANLRTTEGPVGVTTTVESLGLFTWALASTEPDDDETAFASATGVWTLSAADPDYVFASWLSEIDNVEGRATDLETRAKTDEATIAAHASSIATLQAFQAAHLFATFSMTLTSLATLISSNFTVTVPGALVGMPVIVNPGNSFGTSAANQGALSCIAYVSAANTVIVSIRNASAATTTLTASTWSVLVIN